MASHYSTPSRCKAAVIFSAEPDPSSPGAGIYFGNLNSVEALIRSYFDGVELLLRDSPCNALKDHAYTMAHRFAHGHDGDKLIPDWHDSRGMGRSIAERYGLEGDRPALLVLYDLFSLLAEELQALLIAEQEGRLTADQVLKRLDIMAREATGAITGTWDIFFPPRFA